ncbi:MAG: tRNA uridine-5-carboxymethylaminomethyl(34) synthesis enzyme MnmG [Bacteroidales bacterium]|jgi:tRNA uridine 5-carboxymethylaminomethyl modification enzyme|nr:tRNA uridine-5-carboxymethylaminomethyl(34) synthesis enzyme MnmG [Bacteroidales bacterium]
MNANCDFDIIVVGGGHAGCEAAHIAAKIGCKTLLISMNIDRMAAMSCNPAVGGVAKGQIVREIDALGGMMGIVTDYSAIQFRMLNLSKGPAMWSPRSQTDMAMFSAKWREILENTDNLQIRQDEVIEVQSAKCKVQSEECNVETDLVSAQIQISTKLGQTFSAKAIILTNGTFLNGKIHIGEQSFSGGRIGEQASHGITECLKKMGFTTARLKTGTPVRIDGRSIDFSKLVEQKGDDNPSKFSFMNTPVLEKQRSCYLAYTNKTVHQILEQGFDKSPMFQGRIQGVGPRYCPSIEDKIKRFADKTRHQLFVEPQGWTSNEYYLNGFSSSLPEDVQVEALRHIEGFENAVIFRPGYAIEYDYFPPTQLKASLETKLIENLYFAGQINGTTGYEEAAGQGLMAGINAALKIQGREPLILHRDQAYIGVLIDDLVTKGVDEPYRMFTSRAEFRILLRQDNTDERLTPIGYAIRTVSEERMQRLAEKQRLATAIIETLQEKVSPQEINPLLNKLETREIEVKTSLYNLLLRPQVGIKDLLDYMETPPNLQLFSETLEKVEIATKYNSYIEKEQDMAEKLGKNDHLKLYNHINYHEIKSLSFEAREKLSKIRPVTIGQASRISGVSPADIAVLLIWLNSK